MIESTAGLTRLESITSSFYQDMSQKRYLYTPINQNLGLLHINHTFTFQIKKNINIGLFSLTEANSYINIQPMHTMITILQDVKRPIQQLLIYLFPIQYAKLLEDSTYYSESFDPKLEKELREQVVNFINQILDYCSKLDEEKIIHATKTLQDNIKSQEQLLRYEKVIIDPKFSNQISFASMLIIMFLTPFGKQCCICILGEGEYLVCADTKDDAINYFTTYIKTEEEIFKERGKQVTDFNIDLKKEFVLHDYNYIKSGNLMICQKNNVYTIKIDDKEVYQIKGFKEQEQVEICKDNIILPFNCKQLQFIENIVADKDQKINIEQATGFSMTDLILVIIKKLQE